MSQTKKCKYCKSAIDKKAKVCPNCLKKQKNPLKIIGIILLVIIIISAIGGNNSNNSSKTDTVKQSEASSDKKEKETKTEATETKTEIKEEKTNVSAIKESAVELPHKDIMRNPNNYIGNIYKIELKISTVSTGSTFKPAYMKAFTKGEYGFITGEMIFLFDERKTADEGYFKILEDDIIEAYCRFDSLEESKNALSGEKSEVMSLKLLYAELSE